MSAVFKAVCLCFAAEYRPLLSACRQLSQTLAVCRVHVVSTLAVVVAGGSSSLSKIVHCLTCRPSNPQIIALFMTPQSPIKRRSVGPKVLPNV